MEIKGDKGVKGVRGVTSPTGLGVKANSMVMDSLVEAIG